MPINYLPELNHQIYHRLRQMSVGKRMVAGILLSWVGALQESTFHPLLHSMCDYRLQSKQEKLH